MKKFLTGKLVKVIAGTLVGGVLIQVGVDPDTAVQAGQLLGGQVIELMSF